jgi:hypothetical protein
MLTSPKSLTSATRASDIKPQFFQEVLPRETYDNAISKTFNDEAVQLFEVAVASHMLKLREQGRLLPIEVDERRGFKWTENWNKLVLGHDVLLYELISPIAQHVRYAARASTEVDRRQVAADLLDGALGASSDVVFHIDGQCQITGSRAVIRIGSGWQLKLSRSRLREGARGFDYSDFEPVPPPSMIQVHVDAPSGKILVADWFRLPDNEFTEYCKDGEPEGSLSTQYGINLRTEFLAKSKGVLSIFVGNSSPSIYQDGNRLLLANLEEVTAHSGRKKLADTCTDLWWVTMMDEQLLRQRLGEFLHDQGKADSAIDEYLESGQCEVIEVPPGTLFMSFPCVADTFREFDCNDQPLSLQFVNELYAVMSSQPIEWVEWADRGQKRGRTERQR